MKALTQQISPQYLKLELFYFILFYLFGYLFPQESFSCSLKDNGNTKSYLFQFYILGKHRELNRHEFNLIPTPNWGMSLAA